MKASSSQDQVTRIQDEFGGEVHHLNGNMFRVNREVISFAEKGLSSVDGKLVYGNPRWFVNGDGHHEAKGIEKGKMQELKESIKTRGVDHPIRLRITEDGDGNSILEVVNGERRLRAIAELCEEDADCLDVSSGATRPASEVYSRVECRIEYMDDATALCCALQLNETSEVIGDSANINVVKVLRESGYDDQEILKATGKSPSWLREMEQIIGLDEVCLGHYQSDVINKKVALRLALINDVEERVAQLEKIKQAAEERHVEKVRQTLKKAAKAKEEAQSAEIEEFEQSVDDVGSENPKSKASENSSKARKKAEKAEQELKSISGKKAKATSKDADKVDGSSKPLSHAKISSKLLKPIKKLIEDEGICDDGNFDVSHLMLIQAVLEAIISGESDIFCILGEHCPAQDSAEDILDEQESEEAQDEAYASDEQDEEEEEESEDSQDATVYASEEDEEAEEDEDEDENSYVESAEESDDMVADLEREFEEELRAMDRDY